MSSRARLVQSVVVAASIALGISSCKHDTLDSGTQGLALTYTPAPAGSGRFEAAHFYVNRIQALPVHPNTPEIYGTESLVFRLDPFPKANDHDSTGAIDDAGILTMTQTFVMSDIALPVGTYRVTYLEVKHPNLNDDNMSTPVPSDQAHCMDGVETINTESLGVPEKVIFDDPDETAPFTFTIRPGQTTLAMKLDIPAFLEAYQAAFTCQIGCGVNDPNHNCIIAPFNETAYRAAVQTYLKFE